ncbi:MAG: acylphosphatase [Imperialibacter sp.]|uniref:acylphosphatase n=1 Tax=Imperialibacter sp. TaxID=2038411 RepID=UPI0032EE28FB
MVCYQIRVVGKVQGVFYRASTKTVADELGVKGWVKNEVDGSVLIEAEGTKDKLIDLMAWCKKGPLHAKVDSIERIEVDLKHHNVFLIRH